MNIIRRTEVWSERQRGTWILVLRLILGLILWYKGLSFISHTQDLEAIISKSRIEGASNILVLYVTWSHLFGGTMILIGLFTRIAVIIQLPVLIGAVFFIHADSGFMNVNAQQGLSILVLVMLLFFLVQGGGPYSIDRYQKRNLL